MRSAAFNLAHTPALSRAELERAAWLRTDAVALNRGWKDAVVLRLDRNNHVRGDGTELVLEPALSYGSLPPEDAVLIAAGAEPDGRHMWAVEAELPLGESTNLRAVGASLGARDAGLLTTAQAVLNWHRHSMFCARCGGRTLSTQAGWARKCVECGLETYPRTDPAAICLVHDGGDRVLLGRQPAWPQGRYSLLAGFVEAGESAESCVRREVREEVGVEVDSVTYLGSQPWPFPRSLMLGFHAVADPGSPIVPEDGEIEDARWFDLSDVQAALSVDDDWRTTRTNLPFTAPGSVSIARGILESWVLQR
ncbi:NAD(+) diphosphatase [Hoyosella rhizosphaerae]|uniref:NAD(+) diphosphatase n=1 Tax=Hoyosella rhizosphaerae TaxID=1755582 RepID=A0A916UD52_9ACTN|nr:NAD(+) diphosphatase [Hoyosella rhizosphaerae]MBN4925951.1 NAD(+) diphosphatase [Hoyosella rhizosphaerae]GGC66672.1 putative NADH pyrophosphatase/NUDIX hydrolase [Hoyosella rhizosphaerae]